MATATTFKSLENFAELHHQIGDVPLERIRLHPAPGMATEKDVIAALAGSQKHLCELVDGVLVEKAVGTREALLASLITHLFWDYLEEEDIGIAVGADGPFRLQMGLVRFPDACFISWDRLPAGELPDEAIATVIPDLVVEVLSKGNTKQEIERKLKEYFKCGVRLAWVIQPKAQTALVYTTAIRPRRVGKEGSLDGGEVMPGFSLSLKELFARAKRRQRKSR